MRTAICIAMLLLFGCSTQAPNAALDATVGGVMVLESDNYYEMEAVASMDTTCIGTITPGDCTMWPLGYCRHTPFFFRHLVIEGEHFLAVDSYMLHDGWMDFPERWQFSRVRVFWHPDKDAVLYTAANTIYVPDKEPEWTMLGNGLYAGVKTLPLCGVVGGTWHWEFIEQDIMPVFRVLLPLDDWPVTEPGVTIGISYEYQNAEPIHDWPGCGNWNCCALLIDGVPQEPWPCPPTQSCVMVRGYYRVYGAIRINGGGSEMDVAGIIPRLWPIGSYSPGSYPWNEPEANCPQGSGGGKWNPEG